MTYPGSGTYPSLTTFPTLGTPRGDGTIWGLPGWLGYEGMAPIPDDLDCLYFVTQVDGWEGTPPPRVQSDDRPSADGTNDGQSTQPGKTITISGTVRAPDAATLQQAMGRLSGLLMTGDRYGDLIVDEVWLARRIRVRRGAETLISPSRTVQREASFSFVLYGPDGRRLGEPMSASTGLPSTSGGITVPLTVPIVLAELVASGRVELYNPGTAVGPVLLRIDGPVVGPVVTHVASGLQLVFADSATIPAGEWRTVDMERHEVLANGQPTASRNQEVLRDGRGWSGFDPGDNAWTFTATSGGDAARLTVTTAPSWP